MRGSVTDDHDAIIGRIAERHGISAKSVETAMRVALRLAIKEAWWGGYRQAVSVLRDLAAEGHFDERLGAQQALELAANVLEEVLP